MNKVDIKSYILNWCISFIIFGGISYYVIKFIRWIIS